MYINYNLSAINYLNNKEKIRNKKEEKLYFGKAKTCINIAVLRRQTIILKIFAICGGGWYNLVDITKSFQGMMKLKNIQKMLSVLICVVMVVSALPITSGITASAATSGTTGDCTWTLDGTVLTISGNGDMKNYDWYGTSTPWGLLITTVIIEEGVTSIGSGAFSGCTSLTNITIPDSVTSIGSGAFSNCTSLTNVNITDIAAWCNISFVYDIGSLDFREYTSNPFYYAENLYLNGKLVTNLIIPNGVTSIGSTAFHNFESITSVTIPDSVTSIGYDAFSDCTSLTSVTIGNGVTSIGSSAFSNCTSLESITIPDSVTSKISSAFSNCTSLTSVTIGNGVTSIGSSAFSNCTNLTSVIIPDSVTSIDSYAFNRCTSLTSITIPDSVTSIGDEAFSNCTSLTCITIGDSVTSIDYYAFSNCTSLTSVTIPDSVTSIGYGAFSDCTSLTSITIPDSVTSIGSYSFRYCYNLENVYISDIEKWCAVSLGDGYSNPMCYARNLYVNNVLLTDLYFPENMQIIGENQFYGFASVENVFIPKDVVLIKQNAFNYCSGIKNVYFEGSAEEWEEVTILAGNDYLKNATVYFNSTKIPGGITGVTISKLPTKVKYTENTETLDLTGGVLTVLYDGGATLDVDLATLTAEGFDNTKLGKQTITVKYGNYSDTFEVEVIYRPMAFVSIAQNPIKTVYEVGESLDLTGAKLVVGYPEGNYEFIDITEDMVSGYDTNRPSIQVLTVTYKGYTDVLVVTVFPKIADDEDEIDILDIIYIKNALLNFGEEYPVSYDVNLDGDFNSLDMVALRKKVFESF